MRPDLPWNVAGIPPEAREAARAAARREGLSVGEWLTRRIVSGLAGIETTPELRPEWADLPADTRSHEVRRDSETRRDSHEMLEKVRASESETSDIYKRIEDQLRSVGRRLEATERNQSESSRALNRAASEMNETAREQAHAFDQLGAHVVALSDRMEKLERQGQSDGVHDAVKALHQGMTRLADSVAKTASQSESQIAALSQNLESLAGRLGQTRHEAETAKTALENRVAGLSDRVQAMETMGKVPDLSDAVARLSESVRRLEVTSPDPAAGQALDKRLSGIERTLGDLIGRIDGEEPAGNPRIEEALNRLNRRLDAAEKAQEDALASLRKAPAAAAAIVEPPPFAAATAFQPASPPPPPFAQPMSPPPPPFAEPADALPSFTDPAAPAAGGTVDSYLAAARRSAIAAQAEAESQSGRFSGFSWGGQTPSTPAPKSKRGMSVGIAVLALVVVIAAVASTLLSHRLPHEDVRNSPVAALDTKPAPTTPAEKPQPDASTPPPATDTPLDAPAVPPQVRQPDPSAAPAKPAAPTPDKLTAMANAGNAKAALVLGLKYLDGDGVTANDKTAAAWLQKAAAAGEPVAQYRFGTLVEHGRGVKLDQAAAMKLYAAAAGQGNRNAMHNLAAAYASGIGVKTDFAEAARWFQRAANLGLSDSQFNLGVLYQRGQGVARNLVEAYKWYAIAARSGDGEAKTQMDALAPQLAPDALKAVQAAAANFKPAKPDARANIAPTAASLTTR